MLLVPFVSAFVATALAFPAAASGYRYTTSLTGSITFGKLADAEAAMRAADERAVSLAFSHEEQTSSLERIRHYVMPRVEPVAGPWEYGQDRCAGIQWGYGSEDAAVDAGMWRFYGRCSDPEVADSGQWRTPERNTSLICGGPERFPKWKTGIEHINHRDYRIDFCDRPDPDGLNVYRRRDVTGCPEGLDPTPDRLACRDPFTATIVIRQVVADTRKNHGRPPCGAAAGNPCNAVTGNKYQHELDVRLPGGAIGDSESESRRAIR